MLRFASKIQRQIISRQLHGSQPVGSFIKNIQEQFKKGLEEEDVKKDLKAVKLDMDKMADDIKQSGEKFASSEKYKKIMKETQSTGEKTQEKIDEAAKKIKETVGIDMSKVKDKAFETFESVKNIEFTQAPEDRMEIFQDDYVSPNYNRPKVRKSESSSVTISKFTLSLYNFSTETFFLILISTTK